MSRTTPVHAGYTILSGSGTGSNGGRIHVWVEYLIGGADPNNNRTWLDAYFYAALDPSYTSTTSYYTGLNAAFSVDGVSAGGVSNGAYDFTDAGKVNSLGSFQGWVYHDADGTKTVTLEGSFTTASAYISGGSVSGRVTLPAIAARAAVTGFSGTLGSPCSVSWTPAAAHHSFQLTFSLGDWQLTTERIYPGSTRPYTHTATVLPLEVARQFPGATGQMTVALTTYDNDRELGTFRAVYGVTVPENEDTRPQVTAVLSPVCEALPGVYVQKLGSVRSAVSATDPLGAEITGYTISAGGNPVAGTLSGHLEKAGSITVTVTAKNTRGFTGQWSQQVEVFPYTSPRLLTSAAYRCLSDGTADPGGTWLRVAAIWEYSPVGSHNRCSLRWRYQPVGGTWSDWRSAAGTDNADTGPISGVVLEPDKAYTVEVEARDQAGGSAQAVYAIPVEQVYMHRTKDAMGLGGYTQGSELLDVYWNIRGRKSINDVYIRTAKPFGTNRFSVQSSFSALTGGGNNRQSILLFGNDNGKLIRGVIGLSDAGAIQWDGTDGVEVSGDRDTGILTVQLPLPAYDTFILLSTGPVEVTEGAS